MQGTALDPRRLSRLIASAALAAAFAGAAVAAHADALEGHWANPKRTTMVKVSRCDGGAYCAVVVKASAKAQANARKGGTAHFIGTEILRVSPAGNGQFKGKAFDPESNMHVAATVRMVGPGVMELRGCAFLGMICESQRWTKLD
jgi:uncharacterized protein (DUF2147 family)